MWHTLQLILILRILFLDWPDGFATSEALVGDPNSNNVKDVGKNEYLPVALIRAKRKYSSILGSKCAGTLISKKHILTTEHCFKPQILPKHLEVLIGSPRLGDCSKYDVISKAGYKEWSELKGKPYDPHRDDIAVLTLKTNVNLRHVKPFILSPMKDEEVYGKTVRTAGWGTPTGIDVSLTMKTAFLTVLSKHDCNTIFINHNYDEDSIPKTHLCTKADPFVLLTGGDSGGPLFYGKDELVAINGYRTLCDLPVSKQMNSHISIDHFREFIEEALI